MMNENALIIIAKMPLRDSVKTRLRDSMPDNSRVNLYKYLLEDTISRLGSIKGVDTFIAYAPADSGDYFSKFRLHLIPLTEGDLGLRMLYAFEKVFKKGYRRAVLVGVDIPELTHKIIAKAFSILSDKDVVFGPARDGGYYLVGMNRFIREIFIGVPWSTDRTLDKSIKTAEKSGYSIGLTDILSDIDTIEDVRRAGLSTIVQEKRDNR